MAALRSPAPSRRVGATSRLATLLALLAAGIGAGAARAEDGARGVTPAADAAARAALEAYDAATGPRSVGAERAEAARVLGACVHAKVADRLLRLTRTEDAHAVRAALFAAIARQTPFAERIVPRLAAILAEEAEAERARRAKGDAGFRVDPLTGRADTASLEGRTRLLEARERAAAHVALLRALAALGWRPARAPPDLTPFLQDASDDLVIAVLDRMGEWRELPALPAALVLFRMYPDEFRWETGAVVDLAGTNATAQAKWMVLFGHPDKQRARPRVVQALHRMLVAATERDFETPEELAAWLARDEVRKLVSARRGR